MTGLDPSRHVIVEIATLITDDELEIVAEGPDLVVHQPEEALALMEPIVVEMHTKSGLLDAIRASTVTLDEAGARDARVHQDARARGAQGPAVRQLDRDGSALPRPAPARHRELAALPQRRREQREGARAALVPDAAATASRTRPARTARSTTSARAWPSCASTASTSSCRARTSRRLRRLRRTPPHVRRTSRSSTPSSTQPVG